jgi:hypothetical protein
MVSVISFGVTVIFLLTLKEALNLAQTHMLVNNVTWMARALLLKVTSRRFISCNVMQL